VTSAEYRLARSAKRACVFSARTPIRRNSRVAGRRVRDFKEGAPLVTQYGTLALLNRAPMRMRRRFSSTGFLSRDGQIALQISSQELRRDGDSLRIDIPKNDVKPENRRAPGVNYLDIDARRMDGH